eukprot:gene8920-biopygen6161
MGARSAPRIFLAMGRIQKSGEGGFTTFGALFHSDLCEYSLGQRVPAGRYRDRVLDGPPLLGTPDLPALAPSPPPPAVCEVRQPSGFAAGRFPARSCWARGAVRRTAMVPTSTHARGGIYRVYG